MVDHNIERKVGLSFVRLLIEVEMKVELPNKVFFENEKGELIKQKVQYDWKPTQCNFCKKYGHNEGICKKKNSPPNQMREEEQQGEKGNQGEPTIQRKANWKYYGKHEGYCWRWEKRHKKTQKQEEVEQGGSLQGIVH